MVIDAKHISKKLPQFELSDINFTLDEGYVVGLAGRNGSGKTTLIRLLLGAYTDYFGSLSMFGMDCRDNVRVVKDKIGWVLHDEVFCGNRSLISNARHYGNYYSNFNEDIFLKRLLMFNLEPSQRYGKLSKGEQLKFQLAFALAHEPRILIMDEPVASFDPEFRELFYKVVNDFMKDGKHNVIISTHLLSELDIRADYLMYLKDGKMTYYGDMENFRDKIEKHHLYSIEEYMEEEFVL